MSDLIRWLRTYWSDNYNGPPMASDVLGRKAADEIERLNAALEKIANAYKFSSIAGDIAREALKDE